MKQFIFEGTGATERTTHQKIAMSNTKHCINWIVGGYYNMLQDGYEKGYPKTMQELEDEIYFSTVRNGYYIGAERIDKAPKEMKFAGEKFIRAYIKFMLEDDEDVAEILAVGK